MCLLTVSSPFVCGFLCNQHEEMKGWGEEYTSFPTASSCAAFSVASSASRRALALVIDCCERLVSGGGERRIEVLTSLRSRGVGCGGVSGGGDGEDIVYLFGGGGEVR
jgi:hypothetical protein